MENQSQTNKTTRDFLITGKAEGYSFLLLLFIAMPLKYIWHHPEFVRIAGSIHGILFIAFMYTILKMHQNNLLTNNKSAKAFAMSLLPFGTFYLKRLL